MGSNLAREAITRMVDLVIFDNLSRFGSEENLSWLSGLGKFKFVRGDISKNDEVEQLISAEKPDVIFHLAGQVAMTTSIQNPRKDFETNALGTFNLLDSVRKFSSNSVVIYSSTNKVYGGLEWLEYEEKEKRYEIKKFPVGLAESIPLSFTSPYGCSKGAADQYVIDFNRIFGLKTVVFRHSSMYGGRQFSTIDQGWVGWFCEQAIKTTEDTLSEPFTISGNGKQVRDVLHANDMVNLYFSAADKIENIKGEVFNIGGGPDNALSLLELFDILEQELNIKLNYKKIPPRESDQKIFIADINKAQKLIGWRPEIGARQGIKEMIKWISKKNEIMASKELSVIIPAYLEEENLRIILPRLGNALREISDNWEILVIDTMKAMDGARKVCEENGATYINRSGGNDYGDAIRTGIDRAESEYTIFMDADGSHDPEFVKNLYENKENQDIVIASRYVEGGNTDNSQWLILMSLTVNVLYSLVLNIKCKDISNSFKLYKTTDLKNFKLRCNNFDIVEEIMYKLKKTKGNLRIKELPFLFKKRMFGDTKRNLFLFVLSYFFTLIKLRFFNK